MVNNEIDIHADDYGYSLNTSKDILDCLKNGCLNSISIICNTNAFEDSMDLLYKEIPNLPFLPLISVHLNFVEGYNLSNSPLLSRNGINTSSWGDILIASLGGMKKDLKVQLKSEIKAQIEKTNEVIEKCIEIAKKNNIECNQKALRIDSHLHTHSIPIVFSALKEVIEEEHYNVEYIRNPKEPLLPFIRQTNLWKTYSIINFAKNIILNIFSNSIDKYSDKHNMKKMFMWGLVMSGHMDFDRIEKLYPNMLSVSKKNKRRLELLFHPGQALEEEYSAEMGKDYFTNANLSNNRNIEKNAVLKIKEIIG